MFWALVVAISAGLAGVGAGLDKYFMPKHDRVRWYDRLLGWWLSLEDSRLGTLPARVAERLASALDWLLGNVVLAAGLAWLCAAFVVPGRQVVGLGQERLLGVLTWSVIHYPLWLLAALQFAKHLGG